MMCDHDPFHAAFEPDDTAGEADDFDSAPLLDADERYSRPSLRYIDVHDRPTLVP